PDRRLAAALRREGADMHFIGHQLVALTSPPGGIAPLKRAGIDDLGGSVRPLRLKARGRIGQSGVTIIHAKPVAHLWTGFAKPARKIAIGLGFQGGCRESLDFEGDRAAARRPQAEMNPALALRLRPN